MFSEGSASVDVRQWLITQGSAVLASPFHLTLEDSLKPEKTTRIKTNIATSGDQQGSVMWENWRKWAERPRLKSLAPVDDYKLGYKCSVKTKTSSFQSITMIQTWAIRHTALVLHRSLLHYAAFSAVFLCEHGRVWLLPSSCMFSSSSARVASLSTQKHNLCERHLAIYSADGPSESAWHSKHAAGSFFSLYC